MVGMTSGHSQTCVVTAKHMVTAKRVVTIMGMDTHSKAKLPEVG